MQKNEFVGVRLSMEEIKAIEESAEIACVSIWEMMDIMKERKIPAGLEKEDFKKGMENMNKIFMAKK